MTRGKKIAISFDEEATRFSLPCQASNPPGLGGALFSHVFNLESAS